MHAPVGAVGARASASRVALAVACLVSAAACESTSAKSARTVTSSPRCPRNVKLVPACGALWGVHVRPVSDESLAAATGDLERLVGRRFDVVLRYHSLLDPPGHALPDSDDRSLARGRILFSAWQATRFSTHQQLRWADIASGRYDARVIVPTARRVRQFGQKMFLSFDSEMDQYVGIRGTAADYVRAYRHVRSVFARVGADNVIWVWVVTGYLGGANADVIRATFPGLDQVDWVAYDPYNFFECRQGQPWKDFEATIAPFYWWLKSEGLTLKPVMLAEYGTQFDPRSPQRSHDWYYQIPRVLPQYPAIKALLRWSSDRCGLRLANGPGMLTAFRYAGSAPYLRQIEAGAA